MSEHSETETFAIFIVSAILFWMFLAVVVQLCTILAAPPPRQLIAHVRPG